MTHGHLPPFSFVVPDEIAPGPGRDAVVKWLADLTALIDAEVEAQRQQWLADRS